MKYSDLNLAVGYRGTWKVSSTAMGDFNCLFEGQNRASRASSVTRWGTADVEGFLCETSSAIGDFNCLFEGQNRALHASSVTRSLAFLISVVSRRLTDIFC